MFYYWPLIPVLALAILLSWSDLIFGSVAGSVIYFYRVKIIKDYFTDEEIIAHAVTGIFCLLGLWVLSDFHEVSMQQIEKLPIGFLRNMYFIMFYTLTVVFLRLVLKKEK